MPVAEYIETGHYGHDANCAFYLPNLGVFDWRINGQEHNYLRAGAEPLT